MSNRINFIDFLRGFTIIIVILYHITFFHSGTSSIRTYSTPFFMQLFFFASGLFFSARSSFKDYLLNKINRLLIPLLFFYLLSYAVGYFASDILGLGAKGVMDKFEWRFLLDLFNGEEVFHYGGAIWFLICLFNVLIIYYFINKITLPIIRLIVSLAISIIGYYICAYVNLPYFLDSAMTMMFFFALGHFLKGNPIIFEKSRLDIWFLLISLSGFIIIVNNFRVSSKVMQNEYEGGFILFLSAAILGIASVFFFSKKIKSYSFISFFGINSLIILGTHQIVINVVSVILKRILHIDHYIGAITNLLITLSIEYAIVIILSRLVPWLVAKKDLIK